MSMTMQLPKKVKGSELTGMRYEPLFPYFVNQVGVFFFGNQLFNTRVKYGISVLHIEQRGWISSAFNFDFTVSTVHQNFKNVLNFKNSKISQLQRDNT